MDRRAKPPAKTDQGVGRISMIHGEVSTQRGDSGTWSAAVLNQPVVNGDKVSTGAGGRAEVQLDYRQHSPPGIELASQHRALYGQVHPDSSGAGLGQLLGVRRERG